MEINMKKGFSLIEMLIYIGLMVLLLGVIVSTMLSITKSYKQASYTRLVESTGLNVLDRLTREIKNADSINVAQSSFGSNPGRITLNGTDSLGVAYTTEFYVESNVLKIKENGVFSGQITPTSTPVSSFVLRYIDTPTNDAVKIEMTLQAGTSTYLRSDNFYGTASLRSFN